jgi:signal transduction histidine kinase
MREVQDGIRELVDDIRKTENLYEDDRLKLTHLAGVGLMVEFIAHELGRATDNAMAVLRELSDDKRAEALQDRFDVLAEELKTINKRLSVLDPMATTRRQRKTRFDLTDLCKELIESHEAQFKRHDIEAEVVNMEGERAPELMVNAVKGMVIQVIENLVSNSLYWLKVQEQDRKGSKLKITVHIDKSHPRFFFTDTGPGIFEEAAEDVFEPFVSYRRPETGRGLGLYICRQIAEYHDATIRWSERFRVHKNKLNTIEFSFGGGK